MHSYSCLLSLSGLEASEAPKTFMLIEFSHVGSMFDYFNTFSFLVFLAGLEAFVGSKCGFIEPSRVDE